MKMKSVFLCLGLALGAGAADREEIKVNEFPSAGRPFSTAIRSGGTIYVAGQIGRDLKANQIPANFEDEVKACLDNIGIILKASGASFADVLTVNVYLTDMSLFDQMNKVYMTYFPEPRPVRTTVGVAKLVGTAKLEITVTAADPAAAPAKGKKKNRKR